VAEALEQQAKDRVEAIKKEEEARESSRAQRVFEESVSKELLDTLRQLRDALSRAPLPLPFSPIFPPVPLSAGRQ